MKRFAVVVVVLLALFVPVGAYAQESIATYQIVFESMWSTVTHPSDDFPGGAHFSPLIGAIHSERVSFWQAGDIASDGIKQMAETGGTSSLRQEVRNAIDAGDADAVLSGPGLGSDTGQVVMDPQRVNRAFPLVTLVTMIAPSPDWFVGVHDLSLVDSQGEWKDSVTVILYPYDAGTDDGTSYGALNAVTQPREPIVSLQGVMPFSAEPMGTLTLTRVHRLFIPTVTLDGDVE